MFTCEQLAARGDAGETPGGRWGDAETDGREGGEQVRGREEGERGNRGGVRGREV